MAPHDPTAEWEKRRSQHIFRIAHLMIEKFGPGAYDEASRRFVLAWHARTDEPGDEVTWYQVVHAIRALEAVEERAC